MKDSVHLETVAKAIDYIEANLCDSISVGQVCELSPMSSWQFQRIFRAYVGDSIGNYVRTRRLAKAALDISTNSDSEARLIDVAVKYQFSSHEAFTRAFKAEFGLPPNEIKGLNGQRLIHAKPKIDRVKIDLIRAGITKEPTVDYFGPKKFVGLPITIDSPLGIEAESNMIVVNHWMKFDQIRKQIKNRKKGISYGLSLSPSQTLHEESLVYLASAEVEEFETVSDPFVTYELPKTLFACFEVRGFKECCNVTTDYIYGLWMPNSPYKRGIGPDFEIFDRALYRVHEENSVSHYFVPVQPK